MSQRRFFISLLGICDGATAEAAETMSMHNIFSHNCYLCISNNYRNLHCKVCIVAKTLRRDNSVWKIHTKDCDGFFFIYYIQSRVRITLLRLQWRISNALLPNLQGKDILIACYNIQINDLVLYNWLNAKGRRHERSRMDSRVNKE